MVDCKNEYGVLIGLIAIKRYIASFSARDNQLAQITFDLTPDQRMTFQYSDSLLN